MLVHHCQSWEVPTWVFILDDIKFFKISHILTITFLLDLLINKNVVYEFSEKRFCKR